MTADKEMKGNIGEWSELYTFCFLLKTGILKTADRHLNPLSASYLPIIRIIRKEDADELSFYPKPSAKMVEIYNGSSLINCIPMSEFEKTVQDIYSKLIQGDIGGTIKIPEVKQFLDRIFITKLKADTTHKEDIVIQLHDVITNQDPIQAFSIKSYLGGDPTLLNAGRTTNFRYCINPCSDELMDKINSIESRTKIFDRINYLILNGSELLFDRMEEKQFQDNLRMIDYLLPEIVAELLKIHYSTGKNKISEIVEILAKDDPLNVNIGSFYEYKLKSMLRSIALGMVPAQPWIGHEDANGGYVVVKENGEVVCFFLYNKTEFEKYLFDCTKLERASTVRHNYAKVFKENGKYYMNLNLQIRFTKPDNYEFIMKSGALLLDEFID